MQTKNKYDVFLLWRGRWGAERTSATEQQTNMAAWLVVFSPTSSQKEKALRCCVCFFHRGREREHLSLLTLLSFPQSQMKLRFSVFSVLQYHSHIKNTQRPSVRKNEHKWDKNLVQQDENINNNHQMKLYRDTNSPLSLDEKNGSPTSHQIETCDVTSCHVFEPIAAAASIKPNYNNVLHINQTIV